jgi:hypothetical protein
MFALGIVELQSTAAPIDLENLNFSSKLALAGDVGQRALVSSRHRLEDLETVQCTRGFEGERALLFSSLEYRRGRFYDIL